MIDGLGSQVEQFQAYGKTDKQNICVGLNWQQSQYRFAHESLII